MAPIDEFFYDCIPTRMSTEEGKLDRSLQTKTGEVLCVCDGTLNMVLNCINQLQTQQTQDNSRRLLGLVGSQVQEYSYLQAAMKHCAQGGIVRLLKKLNESR